jgi:hypothetical protein
MTSVAMAAVVFVLTGTARVQVAPFPAGDHPSEVRVTLNQARMPGHVSVRLESRGYSCVLDASRSRSGVLEFSTPATCPVDVSHPDARGRIDAHLRSGRGVVLGDRLTLDLRFDVKGRIATRIARSTFSVFGTEFVVPEGWTPTAPVRGTVTSSGSGVRAGS